MSYRLAEPGPCLMAFMKIYLLPILVLFLGYYYSTDEEFRPGEYRWISFGGTGLELRDAGMFLGI